METGNFKNTSILLDILKEINYESENGVSLIMDSDDKMRKQKYIAYKKNRCVVSTSPLENVNPFTSYHHRHLDNRLNVSAMEGDPPRAKSRTDGRDIPS